MGRLPVPTLLTVRLVLSSPTSPVLRSDFQRRSSTSPLRPVSSSVLARLSLRGPTMTGKLLSRHGRLLTQLLLTSFRRLLTATLHPLRRCSLRSLLATLRLTRPPVSPVPLPLTTLPRSSLTSSPVPLTFTDLTRTTSREAETSVVMPPSE